jgi:transcriptional regulator with XRE-family HTH domain
MKIIRTKAKNSLAEDFAKPYSVEEEVDFRKLIVVEELLQFMKREGIKRTELADRMGVPPSRITKMLRGDSNLTIDTLVRAGRAVGADLHQTFAPEGKKVRWICYDPDDVHEAFSAPVRTIAVKELNTPYILHSFASDDKVLAS